MSGYSNPNPYGHVPVPQPDPYAPVAAPYGTPVPVSANQPPVAAPAAGRYAPPPAGAQGAVFASIVPSTFPPGTHPAIIACFQVADQDGSGVIDDREMQRALSSCNQSFSLRTVHLLMYIFTNSHARKIGPKEFVPLFQSLLHWKAIFERFDRDRTGNIDSNELRDALLSLGYSVPPPVLDLLIFKFDKTGGHRRAIEYDNFIECCLTAKGLTERFKMMDTSLCGWASFSYESFMLTVLPFLIA